MRRLLVAAIPFLVATPAAGQSVFVSAGGYANVQRFGHFSSQSPVVLDEDLSDTTRGLVVGVGGNVARLVSVSLEFAVAQELHKTFEPARVLPPQPPPVFTTQRSVDYRSRHASVLIGYRAGPGHRVSAVVLGGMMFLSERIHSLSTTTPPPSPFALPSETTSTVYRLAPVVGIDVPVAIAGHLAIVPQARLYKPVGSSGPIGVWPGVSVRWTFGSTQP